MLNIGSLAVSGLDYILIVDKNYKIVYNTRYDEKINEKTGEYVSSDIMNKRYFDIYPGLTPEKSSVAQCIETKEAIINKRQVYYDYTGRRFITNNVTVPLMRRGELVAVVELAMDVNEEDSENQIIQTNQRFDQFVQRLKKEADLISFDRILTANSEMMAEIEKAKLLARLPHPTLIYGETGTGKELFAQSMITYSQVPKDKVVIQNCAAVPENLMESILFGTVRGVYTGAETKTGLFEQADGGVLFLDELNSIPFHVQGKLLRVLQDGTFWPLGGSRGKRVNVKVIGAMNIDPVKAIEDHLIRKDLFYRFSGGLIKLLPLRERREDVALFADYYMDCFSRAYGKTVTAISREVKRRFMEYGWEGNVRELRNTIEAMVVSLSKGEVLQEEHIPKYLLEQMEKAGTQNLPFEMQGVPSGTQELPPEIHGEASEPHGLAGEHRKQPQTDINGKETDHIPFTQTMEAVERQLIQQALEQSGGNKSRASEILGIPRQTLKYRMEKLDI